MIKDIATEISDEQIVEAIIIVIADTTTLSPASVSQTRLFSNVGERAVVIIVK